MASEVVRKEVMTHFLNEWTATPQNRVVYGSNWNSDFNDGLPWIRVSVSESSSNIMELGSRFTRLRGIITVQCFVPYDAGDKAITNLVDSVRNLLQNRLIGGVVNCEGTIFRNVGIRGNWYQVNVDTDYYYDDIG